MNPRSALREDGYCVLPGVLDAAMLRELELLTQRRLASESADHFERFRYHGSMLPLDFRDEPAARRLIAWPGTLRGLAALGFERPRWLSGYVVSKPPRAPSLWWHQDWWAWNDPATGMVDPPQLFVMFYLRDVDESSGCLRVIPGSHRRPHPLHAALPPAHSEEINALREGVAHASHPDEVAVRARAGDAVVGDVRVLHATYPNDSDRRRTCLTLWYLPAYDSLPESIRAYVVNHPALPPAGWWRAASHSVPRAIRPLLPTYDGDAEPAEYERVPSAEWLAGLGPRGGRQVDDLSLAA
jgi:hypothetical protein